MNRTARRALLLSLLSAAVAVAVVTLAGDALAVSTRSFVLDDADELDDGELDGTAVHSDGSVTLGAQLRRIALDEAAIAWSMVRVGDDVLVGTGNEGKIYRLRGDDVSLFAETEQLAVTSLAAAPDGTVYAGTLPEGKIFSIDGQGQVTELAQPDGVEHVWALVHDGRTLYAATGPEGKVFAIDRSGRAEVYWDSEAAHVMSLAHDGEALYAGTNGEALVVRLRGPGRAEVVWDFPGNEVTAIAVRDGALAVAANEFPDPPRASSSSKNNNSSSNGPRPQPGKGRLYRVSSEGRAERVLSNDDGHFTSVQLADDGTIFAGSGKDGRIYRVGPRDATSTHIDVDERQVLAIDLLGSSPLFVTGDGAAIYRVVPGQPGNALWTSKVLDARFIARFGHLDWRGSSGIRLQTRSGNTEEPDASWSEWSAPIEAPGPIRSPAARFLQIRARFPAVADARLLAVTSYYLPQNQRARIHSVGIKEDENRSKNKNKNRSADDPPEPSTEYELEWKVQNADQDRLRYRIRYRQDDQTVWRDALREDQIHTDDEYEWDTSALPDGYYVVQIEASDELSNPEGRTLTATAESEPLLVDNHPPRLEQLRAAGARVTGRAVDGLGPIAKLEYAVDGGEWRMFFPIDDLLDTRDERFELDLSSLPAGSHIVAVRAYDAGGNSVTAELSMTR